MRNQKKTKEERAEVRRAQNQRAAARKKELGLKRVAVWVSGAALEEAERRGLTRCGVVFSKDPAPKPGAYLLGEDGRVKPLDYVPGLFES